jgi:hypothetical protein
MCSPPAAAFHIPLHGDGQYQKVFKRQRMHEMFHKRVAQRQHLQVHGEAAVFEARCLFSWLEAGSRGARRKAGR